MWFIPLADERGVCMKNREISLPYLSAFRCVHDNALYKSTFTLPYLTTDIACVDVITQFKGTQGHSRSLILIPIESPYIILHNNK